MSENQKWQDMFEEAISQDAEVVNFNALHNLLEAHIDELSDQSAGGTPSTPGDLSKRVSMTAPLASDQQTDVIPPKISKSMTGWITKAECCDDLNKKIFGAPGGPTSRRPTVKVEPGDLSGQVRTLDDKLDDFVSDTSRRVSQINRRVKTLEDKPNARKIEWDENL